MINLNLTELEVLTYVLFAFAFAFIATWLMRRRINKGYWSVNFAIIADKIERYQKSLDRRTCFLIRDGGNVFNDDLIQFWQRLLDDANKEMEAFIESSPKKMKERFEAYSPKWETNSNI